MNTIIEKIQNNHTLNAIKDAANKLAFLNIGIAIAILITHRFQNIDLELLYQISMVITGILMAYFISQDILGEKRDSLKIAVMFTSTFSIIPFLNNQDLLPAYPVIVALIVSLLANVFKRFNENILKSSSETPAAVTSYFNQLFPIISVFIVMVVLTLGLNTYFDSLMVGYMQLIQIASNYLVLLIVIILICSFWYLGIHGVTVISTIMRPFWFQMVLFNAYYFITKEPIAFIGTETFLQWFVWLGGSGGTLGLSFSLRYLAKSKALKDLGKVSFRSNIHNINETVIFGVPIAENKNFRIPFFLTPIVLSFVGYMAISLNVIPNFTLVMPWVLPIPMGALLSSALSLKVMLFSFMLIFISWLIYYPFFRKYDRILLEKERKVL